VLSLVAKSLLPGRSSAGQIPGRSSPLARPTPGSGGSTGYKVP